MNMLQNLHLKSQLLGVQSNFGHNPDIIIYSFMYWSPITYILNLIDYFEISTDRRNSDINQNLKRK